MRKQVALSTQSAHSHSTTAVSLEIGRLRGILECSYGCTREFDRTLIAMADLNFSSSRRSCGEWLQPGRESPGRHRPAVRPRDRPGAGRWQSPVDQFERKGDRDLA